MKKRGWYLYGIDCFKNIRLPRAWFQLIIEGRTGRSSALAFSRASHHVDHQLGNVCFRECNGVNLRKYSAITVTVP
ncbi:hypothetical protein P4637_11700 [Halalkalibacterium halodurans]|uniref:hypothetical protein n=1 Tax=Halalkalibacterium halodurans TaxID=86665 RepID=UPI0010680BD5|nr:hypothetical protein [Halalkalibacterium halodurans]MDY7221731.1 hypothetical protein [Halalkalibacterium halodurans]MDY7241007.1 hypothetical protein [Halalkalibacterium halodurans]MED3645580.1 hypothetical protein [Halalkalibacterium halodurans]MED4079405.1 hypothetical protein [Halalkalibacterium halodurans]MED4085476.1 hypothetical protein [Halalkalibacterium halodurans]